MERSCPMKCKDLNWRTVLHVAVACADIETVNLILAVSTAIDHIRIPSIELACNGGSCGGKYINRKKSSSAFFELFEPLKCT